MATKKQKRALNAARRVGKCLRRKHGNKKKYTLKQKANCGSKTAKAKLGRGGKKRRSRRRR